MRHWLSYDVPKSAEPLKGIDAVSYGHPRDTKPTRGIAMVVASLVGFIRGDIVQFCVNLAHRP